MADYNDNNIVEKLIELLESYQHENSSFFNLGEYTNMFRSLVNDIEKINSLYEESLQNCENKLNELNDNYHDNIKTIGENKEKSDQNTEAKFASLLSSYNDKTQEKKNEVIKTFKQFDDAFMPKLNSINQSKKGYLKEYNANLKTAEKKMNDLLKLYDKEYKDIENNLNAFLSQKNSLEKLNADNYTSSIPLMEEEYKEKELEIVKRSEKKRQDIQNKINEHKKYIMQNTIVLNESITELQTSLFDERKANFEPYEIETTRLHQLEKDLTVKYKEVNSLILDDFSNVIQSFDTELSELRELLKEYEKDYSTVAANFEDSYRRKANEQLAKLDIQISKLNSRIKKNFSEDLKAELDNLTKERINLEKQLIKDLKEQKKNEQRKYLSGQINYNVEIEKLRSKKLKYEAIKNTALNNMISERQDLSNLINNQILLIDKKKSFFTDKDQYNENISVLNIRQKRDLEINGIDQIILKLNNDIKAEEHELDYLIKKNQLDKKKSLELAKLDSEYQQESITNDIDEEKVVSLLKVQQNKLKTNTAKDYFSYEANYLKVLCDTLLEIDEHNYVLCNLEHGFENKKLDKKLDLLAKSTSSYEKHIDILKKYDIDNNENEAKKEEYNVIVSLISDRFKLEEKLIAESFELLTKEMSRIVSFENYLITNFESADEETFNKLLPTVIEIIKLLDDYKYQALNKYQQNKLNVINKRIEFVNDIKYGSTKEKLDLQFNKLEAETKEKIANLEETISYYNSTIDLFIKNNLNDIDQNKTLKLNNPERKDEYLQTINDTKEIIKERCEKIKANRLNIKKMSKTIEQINEHFNKSKQKYELEKANIKKAEAIDANQYAEEINNLNNNFELLINNVNPLFKRIDVEYTYKDHEKNCRKLINNNNKILVVLNKFYNYAKTLLTVIVSDEISNLRQNYRLIYLRIRNQIKTQINDENTNYSLIDTKNNIDYSNEIGLVETAYSLDKEKINNKISELYRNLTEKKKEYENNQTQLQKQFYFDYNCSTINIQNYQDDYALKNNTLKENYFNNVEEVNNKYNEELAIIQNSLFKYKKERKETLRYNEIYLSNQTKAINKEYHNNIHHYRQKIRQLNTDEKEFEKQIANSNNSIYSSRRYGAIRGRKALQKQIVTYDTLLKRRIKNTKKDLIKKNKQLTK